MPRIEVKKEFKLRFIPQSPMRLFGLGEHTITEEELENWFLEAHIEEGNIVVLPDEDDDPEPEAKAEDSSSQLEAAEMAALSAEMAKDSKADSNSKVQAVTDDLSTRMAEAFKVLQEGDFKVDGVPRVQAVEAVLKQNVTAEQVAAAWAEYQAAHPQQEQE